MIIEVKQRSEVTERMIDSWPEMTAVITMMNDG